ncbi:hypothetical protein BDV96DRAFT_654041 [Lophiotrema nucula]|uniref:Uncharacterized protein n=1 Tax=Lophiotrema nucula TaxID=690887 RepID=A0A6A5YJN5_9PLEO|nr:hypothetical protein BDV96DRAFT_654041 [Lophiotrema nucula]
MPRFVMTAPPSASAPKLLTPPPSPQLLPVGSVDMASNEYYIALSAPLHQRIGFVDKSNAWYYLDPTDQHYRKQLSLYRRQMESEYAQIWFRQRLCALAIVIAVCIIMVLMCFLITIL